MQIQSCNLSPLFTFFILALASFLGLGVRSASLVSEVKKKTF